MPTIRNIGKYVLVLALVAIVTMGFLMLLGPKVGNVFSTISSCLGCETSPASTSMPNESVSVQEQLAQIDAALSQSMQSSFAYNAPDRMELNETVTIELLLNPSLSASELGNQITATGTVITGAVEITPRMKAELISQDTDAFSITQIPEDPIQLMSTTETTKWKWLITAKRE